MKGFIGIVGVVGLIATGLVEAVNNFTNPGPAGNTVIQAGGGVTTISWQPDTAEPTISLIVKNGNQDIILINQGPNTGSFMWSVPENIPAGTYTFEIGAGPPNALTGSSTSAPFKIQPCETCSTVPSTALFTPSTTLGTGTAPAAATTSKLSGTAEVTLSVITGSGTTATIKASSGSVSTGTAGTTLVAGTTGSPSKSGSAASGTSTATSSAQKIEMSSKWMGIVAGLVGLWIIPVMYL